MTTHRIVGLKRMINEFQSSLGQKRDIALMGQESRRYDNTGS
jgi:hypothetical protein